MSSLERAEQLHQLGRLEEAEREARAGLAEEPEDPALLTMLASVLHDSGRMAEGLAAAEAACAAAPDHGRSHRVRALLLSALRRHPEAAAAAGRSVELEPENVYAALWGSQVLMAGGWRQPALDEARRAIALAPELADAHRWLGDVLGDLGDRPASEAAYREALRLDPENAMARHNLAVEHLRGHRPGQALRGLLQAGAMDPNLSAPLLGNIAAVLWALEWRLRITLLVGAFLTLATTNAGGWVTRAAAATVLGAGVVIARLTTRGVPAHAGPAIRAALFSDVALVVAYLVITSCVLIYLLILVTGVSHSAGFVVALLVALGLVALLIRLGRRG